MEYPVYKEGKPFLISLLFLSSHSRSPILSPSPTENMVKLAVSWPAYVVEIIVS
jgi:hypothetical protein